MQPKTVILQFVSLEQYRSSSSARPSDTCLDTLAFPLAMQAACCSSSQAAHVPVGRQRTPSRHLQPCHGPATLAQHWLGTVQRRQHAWVPAAGGPSSGWNPEEDPYFKLLNSKMMQNEMIKGEYEALVDEMKDLFMMSSKFPDFDVSGKHMFLDKLDDTTQRYQIFIKRLELSEDPAAREYLRFTNAQMLEGGISLPLMLQGLMQCIGPFRAIVEEEERCSADPIRHAAFKAAMRADWQQTLVGRLDVAEMMETADPEKVARAQNHPEFYKALKEVSDNPTPEVLSRWLGHQDIGPFIGELWKNMQGNSKPAGFGGL